MDNKKEFFADGIGQIHFPGSIIRFNFIILQSIENGSASTSASNMRVIMPQQGFLRAYNSMPQVIDKFPDVGILQKNKAADLVVKGIEKAIEQKKVSYDFARLTTVAAELSCSDLANAVAEAM